MDQRSSSRSADIGIFYKFAITLYYHGFSWPLKVRVIWLLARPHGCLLAALMTGFGQS